MPAQRRQALNGGHLNARIFDAEAQAALVRRGLPKRLPRLECRYLRVGARIVRWNHFIWVNWLAMAAK